MMSVKLHVNVPMGSRVNDVWELGVRDFLLWPWRLVKVSAKVRDRMREGPDWALHSTVIYCIYKQYFGLSSHYGS